MARSVLQVDGGKLAFKFRGSICFGRSVDVRQFTLYSWTLCFEDGMDYVVEFEFVRKQGRRRHAWSVQQQRRSSHQAKPTASEVEQVTTQRI